MKEKIRFSNSRLCRFGLTMPRHNPRVTQITERITSVDFVTDVSQSTGIHMSFLPDILLGDAKRRVEERRRLCILLLLLFQQHNPSADFCGYSNDGKYHLYGFCHVCYSIHDAGQDIMNTIMFVL